MECKGINIRYIPNILTCCRILGSIAILILEPLSVAFFMIYIICGVSNILDGYIARKTKCSSSFGATLDSIADIIFLAVMLFVLLPIIPLPGWVIIWIIGIAVICINSLIIGYVKYRAFASLHTYGNKATGMMLFLFPIMFPVFRMENTEKIIILMACLSAIEELSLNATSQTLNINVKSIFIR